MTQLNLERALKLFRHRKADYERQGPDGGWTFLAVKNAWLDFLDQYSAVQARYKLEWLTEEVSAKGFGGGMRKPNYD